MRYGNQILATRRCIEMFDSLAYTGPARAGLLRCVKAFELNNRERAILEYRAIIGEEDTSRARWTSTSTGFCMRKVGKFLEC